MKRESGSCGATNKVTITEYNCARQSFTLNLLDISEQRPHYFQPPTIEDDDNGEKKPNR